MSLLWLPLIFGLVVVPSLCTLCPPGAGYWPDLKDCQSYVKCPLPGKSNVRDVPGRCWWFRRFSREDLRCEWFWNVDCTLDPKIPIIPEPPTPDMPTIPWPDD